VPVDHRQPQPAARLVAGRADVQVWTGAGRDSIINIASVGASVATREQAHYCAAKGGLLMLTRAMAL
jgi:NAD(P)-dependent dehydrogenase (short-subunit alcohol dehydrogenase family)